MVARTRKTMNLYPIPANSGRPPICWEIPVVNMFTIPQANPAVAAKMCIRDRYHRPVKRFDGPDLIFDG